MILLLKIRALSTGEKNGKIVNSLFFFFNSRIVENSAP